MYSITTTKFTGPLDLLLQLIDDKKMEITEIAIAEVTEQYLDHIENIEDNDPEEMSDFLVVAARLLLLKSRALLPELAEEEDGTDLEKQLKLYKEFVDASKKIAEMINEGHFTYSREKMPISTEVVFSPPQLLSLHELKSVFLAVLRRLDPLVKLPRQAMEKTVSLHQKILEIRNFLLSQKKIGFKSIMATAKNKTEVIVNFLAILELLKQRELKVKQAGTFDDIFIEKA